MSDMRYRILAAGAETGGAFDLITCTLPPFSAGPPLSRHRAHLVGCLVLDGLLALTVNDETRVVGAGELRLLRPGEVYSWWNPAAAPAQLLLIVAPGATPDELQRLAGGTAALAPEPWDTS